MAKIMIIEDNRKLREQLQEVLLHYDYDVYAVEDFNKVEEDFFEQQPNLVILDINLPKYDGNYYCRAFRKKSNIPIIVTSARNSDLDQILSMELGADEYVVKPFNIQLLLAKINALMRRLYGVYAKEQGKQEESLSLYGLTLDHQAFKISYNEFNCDLSKNEYKLIHKFMIKHDQIIEREELLEEIWDMSTFVDDNTLTVNVTRLKNKLAGFGLDDIIKTKRGVGYVMDTSKLQEKEYE